MGGKGTIFLILGFSLIFLVLGFNFANLTKSSVDNYSSYFTNTKAHDIAVSGANVAANCFFRNPAWTANGYNNISFSNGTMSLSIATIDVVKNLKRITSVGTYNGVTKTITLTLQPSRFSRFAYYSVVEPSSIWWHGTDTVYGPFHTQSNLQAARHPVFWGKATYKGTLKYYTSKSQDKPYFYGGSGKDDIPMPTSGIAGLETAANANGKNFNAPSTDTLYFNFNGANVTYKHKYTGTDTTVALAALAPNGVIFAKNAIIRLKGNIQGQYSIASNSDIYLDDDITCHTNPQTTPSSTDLIGILSKKNVIITNNIPNQSNIKIQASCYAETGGFTAQQYDTRPKSGTIQLYGGIIQNTRGAVGTFDSWGIKTGFNKSYRYDDRLMVNFPPFYPGTGFFEIVSWYE
ncbi:MAG: hypothetical protein V1720_05995 [bacterium]